MEYPQSINQFPITEHLENICQTLKNSKTHSLILTAETGAGKSTVLPLALLKNFQGKILMTEPRRLSVLGVANRVSSLLDEEIGNQVGYQIHLDKKISSKTRLEVVTEAILVRMLQEDVALENYNLIVLDEFHERSVQLDLALAFLKEAMLLRDDLYVIIMSATIDSKKIADFMSQDFAEECPVLKIPGKTFPVTVTYEENSKIEDVALREAEIGKTVLTFLPGISDIRKCVEKINQNKTDDLEVQTLHSSISLEEQKKVLQPVEKNKARIIVSSAIAETSITIPDVSVVIDSGFARINRLNLATGMEGLFTEVESEFSAEQRCGRAGRTSAGKCIRLWNKFDPRKKEQEPEILRTDLLSVVLECAARGIYDFNKIRWLDSPGDSAWNVSCDLLKTLECLTDDGKITQKGQQVLKLGIGVRLGCILLSGAPVESIIKFTNYAGSSKEIQKRFADDLKRRLGDLVKNYAENSGHGGNWSTEYGNYLLAGFPDRIAKKVGTVQMPQNGVSEAEYQFAVGKKARIANNQLDFGRQNLNIQPEWIIATDVRFGEKSSLIYDFYPLNSEVLQKFLENKTEKVINCHFENGKIQKEENICYGKIQLKSKKLAVSDEDFAAAWVNEVLQKGLDCLPLDKKSEDLITRWEFCVQQGALSGQNIAESVEKWLPPFLGTEKKITAQIVYDALYWYLEGDKVDKLAPSTYILSTNKKVKVNYEKLASPQNKNQLVIRPVIEVIIQRMFGCFKTPEICGMKVLLRLLSPAQRPLQITDDLENFWTGAWPEICKEMKGRYPKHNWDYKIVQSD